MADQILELERRRADRLLLAKPVPGRIEGSTVKLREISFRGGRVEHDTPIVSNGQAARLTFLWDGEEITIDCTVAHSERLGINEPFSSGLKFAKPADESPALRRMIASLAANEEIERLKTIVEASKLINSSIEADSLFNSILAVARRELGVERGTLYFVDQAKGEIWSKIAEGLEVKEIRLPMGKGIAGSVAETGQPVILYDAYSDPRFDRSLDKTSGFRTRSMLCVPIRNREGRIVGVLQLLNKKQGSFGPSDLDFLGAISDHMAIAMENATLHLSLLEKNRMERELQLGREIQSRLLPSPPIDIDGTELAARSVPCFEVGGDYYDFIEFPDGDLGLAMADVSGKGVAAALIMSSIQAALRIAAPLEDDLSALMTRLNALLYRMARGRKYATFFFGRYTPENGVLRYVNAGHCHPLLVGDDDLFEEIASTGRPIGILPEGEFHERSVTIPPGAMLFLYTDGLSEAMDPQEKEFSMERLRAAVQRHRKADPETVAARVLETIAEFERGAHPMDDKTVVVMRRAWGGLA